MEGEAGRWWREGSCKGAEAEENTEISCWRKEYADEVEKVEAVEGKEGDERRRGRGMREEGVEGASFAVAEGGFMRLNFFY